MTTSPILAAPAASPAAVPPLLPVLRPAREGAWTTAAAVTAQGERSLLERVERLLKGPAARGWSLLILHLSRLAGGPAPYQTRIATAVLEEAAARNGGQVHALANGDLALLFRPVDGGAALAATVARLFLPHAADPARLRTLFPLPHTGQAVLAELRARVAAPPAPPRAPCWDAAEHLVRLQEASEEALLPEILERRTGVLLRRHDLRPIYRDLALNLALLAERARVPPPPVPAPACAAQLAAGLERRLLRMLTEDLRAGGPATAGLGQAALHLTLSLHGILSAEFAAFAAARAARDAPPAVAVAVPFVDAFADATTLLLARERLALSGMSLVLDGVGAGALPLTALGALRPSLIKIAWSEELGQSGAEFDPALSRLGPDRLVLANAGAEAAIAWGRARGIRRFEGAWVDMMLAAERLRACGPGLGRCAVRACTERALSLLPGVRDGCLELPLLDAAAPGAEHDDRPV